MYTPKDLSFEDFRDWRKCKAPAFDVLDLNPLSEYKVYPHYPHYLSISPYNREKMKKKRNRKKEKRTGTLLSEYTTGMGCIKHLSEVGLRPVGLLRPPVGLSESACSQARISIRSY